MSQIAPHRRRLPHPHVADSAEGLGDYRKRVPHKGGKLNGSVGDQRTDADAVRLLRDLIEPGDRLKVHEVGIMHRSLLH